MTRPDSEQSGRHALAGAILDVNDDSDPRDKAIFHLFSALDDIEKGRNSSPAGRAKIGLDRADAALAVQFDPMDPR